MTPDDLRQVERTGCSRSTTAIRRSTTPAVAESPGLEEIWDRILTSGRLLYGIAVDDAHHFKQAVIRGVGTGTGVDLRPGRTARRSGFVEAIERRRLLCVNRRRALVLRGTPKAITLKVKATTYSRYRVQFIGPGGKVLAELTAPAASYTFKGDEGYVRARISESNGYAAWAQPVAVGGKGPSSQ